MGGLPGLHQIRSKMYAAIVEGGLLVSGLNYKLPPKHHVGSMTSANADQMAGFMVCGVLPCSILSAFSKFADGDPGTSDTDDYRLMMKRKVWRVLHSVEEEHVRRRMIINFLSNPLDKAWIRIQHMDARGGILMDLTRRKTNPFHQALGEFSAFIFEEIATGPLQTLFWYLGDATDEVRLLTLELCLQSDWRFSKFDQEPFSLVAFGDLTRTYDDKIGRATTFKKKPFCCREPDMEDKVWMRYDTPDAIVNDIDFEHLMANWSAIAGVCSMDVERLIALIKAAIEVKRPPAERVCASGFLSQWHTEHLAAGGRDAKFHKRTDLVASGAPLNSAGVSKNQKATPNEGRGHIEYMNLKYAERKAANGGPFPREQALQLRRQLCNEYWTLPLDEQQKYEFVSRNKVETDISLPAEPTPSEALLYDRNNRGVLWGNSCLTDAINPAEAERILLKEWLGTPFAELGGFNSYAKRLRQRLVDWTSPDLFIIRHAACRNVGPNIKNI